MILPVAANQEWRDWSSRLLLLNAENRALWGRGENRVRRAVLVNVGKPARRGLQAPKARKELPALWGQGENRDRAVRRDLPAIRRTVFLHRSQIRNG